MPAAVLDAVRALAPAIRASASAIERARRLPPPLVHDLALAGVFRLCVPRELGGLEAPPGALLAVLEALGAADGSTGWCGMIGATTGVVAAYLPDAVARALLCDVIFMADTATIGDPHVKVGIVAGDGGCAIWPLAVGPARAKQYLLTGDPLTAVEAERIGLVNRVVPAADLDREASAFAERLAAGAPLAVRSTKLAVNKLVKDALNVAFDTSTALELVTFQSEDHVEALAALREKRRPVFKGR